jgi:hypothetical protein
MDELSDLDAAIAALAAPENAHRRRMTRYEVSIYNYTEAYELSEDMCNALLVPGNVIGDHELQPKPARSDSPLQSRKRSFIEMNFPGIWGSTEVEDVEFIIKATSSFNQDKTIQDLPVGRITSRDLLVLELKRDQPLPRVPTAALRCLDLKSGDDLDVILVGAAYHK